MEVQGMPDSMPRPDVVAVPSSQQLWTGRIDFGLMNGRGWRVGTAEVVVRIDTVSLWWANRTLAVMDRDAFGAWLVSNEPLFDIDDVVWSKQGPLTVLTIDNRNSYVVPRNVVEQFLGVI
jgi:hypothetical protein